MALVEEQQAILASIPDIPSQSSFVSERWVVQHLHQKLGNNHLNAPRFKAERIENRLRTEAPELVLYPERYSPDLTLDLMRSLGTMGLESIPTPDYQSMRLSKWRLDEDLSGGQKGELFFRINEALQR